MLLIQLAMVTKGIILRRTADLLESYLPSKYEMVLFCTMSPIQRRIYGLCSEFVNYQLAFSEERNYIPFITLLRRLCNSPELLRQDINDLGREPESSAQALARAAESLLDHPAVHYQRTDEAAESGKLAVLHRLLANIYKTTNDRVVIVSNYTSTLDVLQRYCSRQKFTALRLDGRTKQDIRTKLVNQFNKNDGKERVASDPFVFLLSSKSGGFGLNLIGANRLILFDSDWNPATDRQAMARIHRDGQLKPCYIYRMLLVGSMDEKIFQRQVTKIGLSDALMGNEAGEASESAGDSFSQEELKDIFNLHLSTRCLTHDLLGCACGGSGSEPRQIVPENGLPDVVGTGHASAGFVSAAKLSREKEFEQAQRKKLVLQLGDFRHYDFGQHADKFTFDNVLRESVAGQEIIPSPNLPSNRNNFVSDIRTSLGIADLQFCQMILS